MTDRDQFAAAALTGLLAQGDDGSFSEESYARAAYRWADAMLRERDASAEKCSDVRDSRNATTTDHDAAPAAKACEDCHPQDAPASGNLGAGSNAGCTGKQTAPPCVETDGFSSDSRTGQINRTPECESPRRECGESQRRDVPQPDNGRAAGGPAHHISEAEIDALECVVEDGRIVGMSVYGRLRSLLVRLRPEWEDESDRPKPINNERLAALEQLSALDQELELKHGITGNPMIKPQPCKAAKTDTTLPRNGTPAEGSVQGESTEPVAWAVAGDYGQYAVKLCLDEASAVLEADRRCRVGLRPDYVVVPLYRHPQPALTDAEREAVNDMCEFAEDFLGCDDPNIVTLRGLLERLK